MNISGDIYSREADGIYSSAGFHTISIASTGSVFGHVRGITVSGNGNKITNAGQITGATAAGIFIDGAGSNVNNSGSILSGNYTGVDLGPNNNVFANSGTVEASDVFYAVRTAGSVANTGTLQAGGGVSLLGASTVVNGDGGSILAANPGLFAILGSAGVDLVTNNGLMQGGGIAVTLQGGHDTYDGRGGQVIGEVQGDNGNDTLLGGAFLDVLRGGTENDTLSGGGASDTLDGGDGNDTYVLGADTTDTILDSSGPTDLVKSTITRVLSGQLAPIENLVLEGNSAINGTGNAGVNGIIGNGATNTLDRRRE